MIDILKAIALVNKHKYATCGQGDQIYQKRNDINYHFKNQHDFCHTICATLLHELYDGANIKTSKIKNKKKGKKVNKERWINKYVRKWYVIILVCILGSWCGRYDC